VARFGQVYAFFGRTPVSTVKNKNLSAKSNDVLNSCIQLKLTRISRKLTIPQQVCFCLDAKLLEQIAQNQADQVKLALSATNLANLRYYALLNLPWKQRLTLAQSCLIFSTEYSLDRHNPDCTALFRSEINLEGKISQQIKQELAQNPSLLNQISQAHYWLIGEILAQLPFKPKAWHSWSSISFLAIAIIIINLITILIWYLIPLNYPAKLLFLFVIFLGLKIVSTRLITKQFKSWIIYHLLDGLLATNIISRRLGLQVLSFLL
jgi:hypothetical protein